MAIVLSVNCPTTFCSRARYLRLPSPGYKSSASAQQSHDTLHLRPLLHRPLRSQISANTDAASNKDHIPTTPDPVYPVRTRAISSLLAPRPGLGVRTATTGDPSHGSDVPASAHDDRRDRLWSELRGRRLYALPDDRAKSR